MKALQYDHFGEPADVVKLRDVQAPLSSAEEVLVRVRLSPIHNHDLATIRGIYGVKPALPAVGGTEILGEVDGRRVGALARGAWAEYAIAHPDGLVPIPDGISDEIGAQLLAMPMSAIALFDDLRVGKGEWIVQNAANGSVGRTIIAVARKAGVNVLNLVRRDDAAGELRANGAQYVIVQQGDWVSRVREVTSNAPIARVVDSVCDANSLELNRLLAANGEHVVFGALAMQPLCVNPGALIYGQTQIRGFWMIKWMTEASAQAKRSAIERCFAMALAGELLLPVAGTYTFENASDALREAERPGHSGKVLVSP
jgi:NADPH:quinone reductase